MVYIDRIFSMAKDFMRLSGNGQQWTANYPTSKDVVQDIKSENAFVCVNDEDIPVGTFALCDYEPSYEEIDGKWLSDSPYIAVHRLATMRQGKAGSFIFAFLTQKYAHIRVDTHDDNKPMQGLLAKFDFKRCGIIYIPGHGRRVAFEFLR